MSLISIEQFEEFAEEYPELAQCYDIEGVDEDYDPTEDPDDEYFNALRQMEVL